MSAEGIKQVLQELPFRPFKIRMASGNEFKIEHPDFVAASPSYRRLHIVAEDHVEIIDTLMIESIQQLGDSTAVR